MTRILYIAAIFLTLAGALIYWSRSTGDPQGRNAAVNNLQRMVSPGALSAAHTHLENNCSACHTPVKGAEPLNCISCHANETDLLQRQPTAFHADISSCVECHKEHQGLDTRPTQMNHDGLVDIGLRQLDGAEAGSEQRLAVARLMAYLDQSGTETSPITHNPHISQASATLDCISCHKNDDRHFGLFGNNCMQCHGTEKWTIPEFLHPSSTSMDCAQCHQAPPSHYMKHFNKISQTVAGKPHARVDQCYTCHQTTSWPDIKNVGWYRHH